MFERSNVAADHQQLLMVTLKRVAQQHGMECLFHEKPFEGINGSGKHVNFSLGNSTEGNLLLPGDTPHENAQFLVFCAAVIRSVHKFGGLLRASVASATNDHRLGANEAPPAIISIFLGEQLADVFDQIAKGGATSSKAKGTLGDRRRHAAGAARPIRVTETGRARSPSPATASSFGLRARCSRSPARWSRSTRSSPRRSTTSRPSSRRSSPKGTEFNDAVQKVLEEIIDAHGDVVFNQRQLLRRLAGQRRRSADCRTFAPPSTRYRSSSPTRRWSSSVTTACSAIARCTAATTSPSSSTP